MAIFVCPFCRETNTLDDKFIGKKGRCKKCRTIGEITDNDGKSLEDATLQKSKLPHDNLNAEYDSESNEYEEYDEYEHWPPPEPPPVAPLPPARRRKAQSSEDTSPPAIPIRKMLGAAVIAMGGLAWLALANAGSELTKAGESLVELRSIGGGSVAEAYYNDVGKISLALATFSKGLGMGLFGMSVALGANLITSHNN